jgi:hypothetical protein
VLWDTIFHGCSTSQQRELLALAGNQGLLYAHQLPPGNGAPVVDSSSHVLTQLLLGQVQHLEPVRPSAVTVRDRTLDAGQRDAVAKATSTPDICLVQGLPGTGKSRVVAEILAQAAVRGERALLLAPSPIAVDRVLELLEPHDDIYALRLLGPDEKADSLSDACRKLTLTERLRELSSQAQREGRQTLTARDQHCRRLRQDEPLWTRLQEMADRLDELDGQTTTLSRRRSHLTDELQQEAQAVTVGQEAANSFQAALEAGFRHWQEIQTRVAKALLEVRERIENLNEAQGLLQTQLNRLRPLADAQRSKRWWTGLWWRALFRKGLASEVATLDARRQEVQQGLGELDHEVQRLNQEGEQARQTFEMDQSQRSARELTRRQAGLDNQEAAFNQERKLLQGKWQNTMAALLVDAPRPPEQTPVAVHAAHAAWRQQVQREEQECALLRQWLACLEETHAWPARVRTYANVVAASTAALAADRHFWNATGAGPSFDLLVLQDADQLADADLLTLARHARRWVLIGAPATDRGRGAERMNGLGKVRPQVRRTKAFENLWQSLHWEPRSLPYVWVKEGERLCCQLHVVAPDQRQWIETENVADFPDVELRILALPRTQPVLAEVVFPPTFSIEQAKKYVYQEVGELAVETPGQSVGWAEEPGRLVFRLVDEAVAHTVRISLEPGVSELVGSMPAESSGDAGAGQATHWPTCCLEFDCATGWDRLRAEEWVQEHLGVRDLGRTARLNVAHRMHPYLAAVVSHVLFGGDYQIRPTGLPENGREPARVDFVPVPPLRERSESLKGRDAQAPSGRGGPFTLPRKGGAGLEIDLADPRQRTRLPSNLGVALPSQGFVNHLEAQAVVRTLEAMAAEPTHWPGLDVLTGNPERPVVAVLALYPAQVDMLRELVRQSPNLAAAAFTVVVDGPAALQEREVAMVLLSLTRSHAHRPITFGERPDLLTLALTRARSQVVVFGDPGALARRSQWEGPLDHLDEATAAREREVIAQLVQYLEGHGAHPHAFHLREGAGT